MTESTSHDRVRVEYRDAILTLTLNTPANGNLLDAEMGRAIIGALASLN